MEKNNIDPEDYLVNSMVEEHIDYIKSPEYKEKKQMEVEEQIEQYIESRIKEYKDRAQEVEGLVLMWRMDLKEKCQEIFNNVNPVSAWHEHDKEDMENIRKDCFKPLEKFDKHFNITTQREGKT